VNRERKKKRPIKRISEPKLCPIFNYARSAPASERQKDRTPIRGDRQSANRSREEKATQPKMGEGGRNRVAEVE